MFDLSLGEMVLIAVLVLVFVGPDDIPALMRTAGRHYAKLRRASDELRRAFNTEVAKVEAEERRDEMRKRREEMERRRAAAAAAAPPTDAAGNADPAAAPVPRPGTVPLAEAAAVPTDPATLHADPLRDDAPIVLPADPRLPDDAAPMVVPVKKKEAG